MPRSFRYDHFTAQKPNVSRSLKNKEKQRVSAAEFERGPSEGGLHYGKRHAETEELAKAKAETDEDRTSGRGQAGDPPPAAQKPERSGAPPPIAADAIEVGSVAVPPTGVPIAIGLNADQPPPRGAFDVLDEGRQEVERLSQSALELGRAGLRLAELSVELSKLLVRKILTGTSS